MLNSVSNGYDFADILKRPIAHRGLHDCKAGILENSLLACQSAMNLNYGIEVDLIPAADGVPMVFHDHDLSRLTNGTGLTHQYSSVQLQRMKLKGMQEIIPTFQQLLELIQGQVPLIVELKGYRTPNEYAELGKTSALLAQNYKGPLVFKSFYSDLINEVRQAVPQFAVGLVAEDENNWSALTVYNEIKPDFLSYNVQDLPSPLVTQARAYDLPIMSWTVRNADQAALAYDHVDQIVFEGFRP